jgi:histidinol phosphatase-like enzyme
MFLRAARDHGLDLARAIYIGDRVRDVAAAERLGGTAFLVRGPQSEPAPPFATAVDSVEDAVELILGRVAEG